MKVAIVDSQRFSRHSLVTSALKYVAHENLHECSSAASLASILVNKLDVDLIVSDLELTDADALQTLQSLQNLKHKRSKTEIVVFTRFASRPYVATLCAMAGVDFLYDKNHDVPDAFFPYMLGNSDAQHFANPCRLEIIDSEKECADGLISLTDNLYQMLKQRVHFVSPAEIASVLDCGSSNVYNQISAFQKRYSLNLMDIRHLLVNMEENLHF
ncbi:hypothetical protein [Enterovibrio norvegicus]|uniref:hypothetical protein n=1 Tax=Enterovibrio norvegicus TaxID=188144 RepID=UPI00352CFA43